MLVISLLITRAVPRKFSWGCRACICRKNGCDWLHMGMVGKFWRTYKPQTILDKWIFSGPVTVQQQLVLGVIPLFAQPHFHISACLFTYFRLFICILRHSFAYAYSFAYHFASYNYACAFVAKRCYTCKKPYCLRNPHCLLSHFVSYT